MKCSHFYLPLGFGWERKTKTYLCFKLKRFIVLSDEHNHHRNSFWNCIFISISVVYTYIKTRLWVNWCIFFYSKVLFQTTIPYQIHGNDRDTKERFHQHDFLVKKRSVKISVFAIKLSNGKTLSLPLFSQPTTLPESVKLFSFCASGEQ